MLTARKTLFLALAALCLSFSAFAGTTIKMSGEQTDVLKWVDARFAKGKTPPFSFELDGRSSDSFIRTWRFSKEVLPGSNEAQALRRYTWTSPAGLRLSCDVTAYPASKAVEWVISFENSSASNSSRLSKVRTADFTMAFPADEPVDFHYIEGNWMNNTDYCPKSLSFAQGDTLSFSPTEGRSTSGAFPYYNITSPTSKQGVVMAIGWAGTWESAFRGEGKGKLAVEAGVKYLDSYLKPSERIQLASVVLKFWSGSRAIDGNNAFRRFQLSEFCRKGNGTPADNEFLFSSFPILGPNPYTCHSSITEDWGKALINRFKFFGIMPEAFWLDAGWYKDSHKIGFADATGNWTEDAERFPNGMKALTDHAHANGTKFMLWFEPERVVRGTQFALEHPEWLLHQGPNPEQWENWMLFDMSNDAATDFLCQYMGDLIEKTGLDWYREDCNIMPGPIWALNDEPGRKGMKEVHHVMNHFRYWDYLRKRFPEMIIDNCASGGKRMDWESIKRSFVFWQDDYIEWNDIEGLQTENYGLNYFIPIHGTGARKTDKYTVRSAAAGALALNWDIASWDTSTTEMQERIAEYKSIRDYYSADYYPLSGGSEALLKSDIWMAYQLHRSSDDSGIVMAFRRKESADPTYSVRLESLDPAKTYILTDADSKEIREISGAELSQGLELRLSDPASSILIYYSAK